MWLRTKLRRLSRIVRPVRTKLRRGLIVLCPSSGLRKVRVCTRGGGIFGSGDVFVFVVVGIWVGFGICVSAGSKVGGVSVDVARFVFLDPVLE